MVDTLCFCGLTWSLHRHSFGRHPLQTDTCKTLDWELPTWSFQPHLTTQGWLLVQWNTSKPVTSARVQSINVLHNLELHRMHLVDEKIRE